MRPKDHNLANHLDEELTRFNLSVHPLPGISDAKTRKAFVEQILESVHRVEYVHIMRTRDISPKRLDASTDLFDPLKAAQLHKLGGNLDEAFWLVFLSVHFGKHGRTGWTRVRDVYGALGHSAYWTWHRTTSDIAGFRHWLAEHLHEIRGGFGNHRKYQSLHAYSQTGTGNAVESYVRWVTPPRTHFHMIQDALEAAGDSRRAFRYLYRSMQQVSSFGRIGCFDYLAMLGKMDLASIEPDSTYMSGATGPRIGARLLLGSDKGFSAKSRDMDSIFIHLGDRLGVGMQVLEDAICNWQKSPSKFVPFRG